MAGCSLHAASTSGPQSPLVGSWLLDLKRTDPQSAADPNVLKQTRSTLSFTADGQYRSVSKWGKGQAPVVVAGRYRVLGSELYLKHDNAEDEITYEINGNTLMLRSSDQPTPVVYRRK